MSAADPTPRPGRLILIVGPSGAGKDSLISAARDRLHGDPRYLFPRRVVTRPASDAEDNEAVDDATFGRMAESGAFAVHWTAHGLRYGIPKAIDPAIAAGGIVVCNVSRTVVADLRARYAHVRVVEVTAPSEILSARLRNRRRAQDGDLGRRLARSDALGTVLADVTILNASTLHEGSLALLAALRPEGEPAIRDAGGGF